MKQLILGVIAAVLFAVPCFSYTLWDECDSSDSETQITRTGFSQSISDFAAESGWSMIPDRSVLSIDTTARDVSLTYRVPGAAELDFTFYTFAPMFFAPSKSQSGGFVVGPNTDSQAVSGVRIEPSSCVFLRRQSGQDVLYGWYGDTCYQLFYSSLTFTYQMEAMTESFLPKDGEGRPGRLVFLEVSGDGSSYSPAAYSIVEIRSQTLEERSGNLCAYECTARLPLGTNYVRLYWEKCETFPVKEGGQMRNNGDDSLHMANVVITYAGLPAQPGTGGDDVPNTPAEPDTGGENIPSGDAGDAGNENRPAPPPSGSGSDTDDRKEPAGSYYGELRDEERTAPKVNPKYQTETSSPQSTKKADTAVYSPPDAEPTEEFPVQEKNSLPAESAEADFSTEAVIRQTEPTPPLTADSDNLPQEETMPEPDVPSGDAAPDQPGEILYQRPEAENASPSPLPVILAAVSGGLLGVGIVTGAAHVKKNDGNSG